MRSVTLILFLVAGGIAHGDIVQVKATEKVVAVGRYGRIADGKIYLTTCAGKAVEYSADDHSLNKGESDCQPTVENRLPAQLGIAKEDEMWRVVDVKRFGNYFSDSVAGDTVKATVEDGSIKLTYRGQTITIK